MKEPQKLRAEPDPKAAPEAKSDDTSSRSWVVPITTALALAAAFCLYYFVYVQAKREYLVNRNFRSLAALGDQLQRILSTHATILEFYSELAEEKPNEENRAPQKLVKFLVVRPEDRLMDPKALLRESRKDYLHYLAPTLELIEASVTSPKPPPPLQVQRHDGRWQLVLSAPRNPQGRTDYRGSLEIEDLLKRQAESLPFDDILLVADDGTVVYQDKKAGPQFTTLSSLMKARTGDTGSKPASSEQTAESGQQPASPPKEQRDRSGASGSQTPEYAWRGTAIHLTDVLLAGTRNKLFIQPILIDVVSSDTARTDKGREWALCGLRSSSALEWEALSISYTAVIGFTALFFAICMGGPVLKVIFINSRERFRLRELGLLSLFLVLLAGVFTLTALQFLEFRINDGTEEQLRNLGYRLSENIHDDLKRMREQLQEWCADPALGEDLKTAETNEVIRNTVSSSPTLPQTPKPTQYSFVNNAFWTDDDGHQVVKWSTGAYVTPLIDLSKQRIYTSPKRTYLDGKGPPFHFESILPPNKLEYLAAMTMDTLECNPGLKAVLVKDPKIRGDVTGSEIRGYVTGGSAVLAGQPLSLVDPILPFGYNFALVDETGLVLFHSDKTRNGRENFREESDWSKELYAGIFGHSTGHSLHINYLGKDSRALVVPIRGITDAPWSLIVYADLSSQRTLALQTMTMAASMFLIILMVPALAAAIWCLARRPRFAPERLWPDQHRMSTYLYQICLYVLLIFVFLLLAFHGPIEQIVVACAAIPYSALLLTLWCFRRYPSATEEWRGRNGQNSGVALLAFTVIVAVAFFSALVLHWPHLKALILVPVVVGIAIVPLLDGPCRYIAAVMRQRRRAEAAEQKAGSGNWARFTHVQGYALSVMLLMLLLGVLVPMALFRGCLAVEGRLAVKQAQLHLASAFKERRATILDKCESGEIGAAACKEFRQKDSPAWRKIALNPSKSEEGWLAIVGHEEPSGAELYEDWIRNLIYLLHHDYNSAAAETLGVIPDRIPPKTDGSFPDWSWENNGSMVTLRLHGVSPPEEADAGKEGDLLIKKEGDLLIKKEGDLLIKSEAPQPMDNDALGEFGIVAAVMGIIGGVLWMLMRKVFLIQLAPLKMTGARELADALRLGRSVLVLVPPIAKFDLDTAARSIDLTVLAREPEWVETVTLDPLPQGGVLEIRNFEYASATATVEQKRALLDRLMKEKAQVAAVMQVPASAEDYRRMFPQLTVVDLREEPFLWLKQYEGPAQDLIWAECSPISALWPLGAQLALDLRSETTYSDDTVASEILERADPYYRLVWKECSEEQKFVLSQLAEDGLLNPTNGRAIRQLMRRGFIVQDPQFRIMNESFRRFLPSVVGNELKQQWLRESRRSGWGRVHGAFVTTMIVLGIFLLTTQNALWQSSAAYVTTAFGALGTLARLFNTYRGSPTAEKAN